MVSQPMQNPAAALPPDALEALLGEKLPPMPAQMTQETGGLPPEAVSLLTGDPAATPMPPGPSGGMGAEAAVPQQGSPTPAMPAMQAPAPVTPPPQVSSPDLVKDFWNRHGRPPTTMDISAARAIPMLERTLGRTPRRIEVLQFLGSRQETPEGTRVQFQPDVMPADPAAAPAPAPAGPAAAAAAPPPASGGGY